MKGRKGSIDEGGVRVPFLIRWPDGIEAGLRVDEIAGAIDLLPTLADIAGIDLISKKPLDGKSVKPLLDGSAGDWPDREIFSFRPGKGASSGSPLSAFAWTRRVSSSTLPPTPVKGPTSPTNIPKKRPGSKRLSTP